MPASIIKSFAEKSGKTEKEVESLWNQAKASAEEQGRKEDYAYIVGILKRMLKINEGTYRSYIRDFLIQNRE